MRRDRWRRAALGVTATTILLTAGVCGLLHQWLAVPHPDGAPGSAAAAPVASQAPLLDPRDDHDDVILGRSLFDSTPRSSGGGGVRTVDAMLILTSVATDPAYSTALIVEGDAVDPEIYAEGDDLDGATVERIERARVVVRLPGGDRETLTLGTRRGHELTPVEDAPAAAPSRAELKAGITRRDDTHFAVEREALEGALTQLHLLIEDASVVPNFQDGHAAGYRLVKVRKGGLVDELGLRGNDLLTGVNDLSVDPATLYAGLGDLKQADEIRLQLERNGAPLVVQYEIR